MGNSLLKRNPFLREQKARRAGLRLSAASSSAVEGTRVAFADTTKPVIGRSQAAAKGKAAKSGG
jgi:hypothetical protein